MACVALLGLVACGGDPTPMIMVDGSAGTDSGTPGTDSGTPGVDAGPADTCPAETAPAPTTGDTCAAETLTCLMSATSQAAQQACLEADPMPMPCAACLSEEATASCSADGVCDEEWGEVGCCVDETCSGAPNPGECEIMARSPGGACATQQNAFGSCAMTAAMGGQCGNTTTFCFAEASTFFPEYRRARIPFFAEMMTITPTTTR